MFQCTSVFSYHFEFSDSSSCPLYLGNLIMSPTWQISLVVLSICFTLPWVISVSCSLFKDSSHYLIYSLIQSLFYLLSFSLCLPSFTQFLVTLVIRWRIYCLPYHIMVLFQYFLKMKISIFDDRTSGFTSLIGEFLFFSCWLSLID